MFAVCKVPPGPVTVTVAVPLPELGVVNVNPAPLVGADVLSVPAVVVADSAPLGVSVAVSDAATLFATDCVLGVSDRVYAVNVTLPGSVSPASSLVLMVFAPALLAVYTNVPTVFPVVILTVLGVNVPPAPPSLGVIVTVDVAAEFSVAVKFVDATPGRPALGPVSVYDVGPLVGVNVSLGMPT